MVREDFDAVLTPREKGFQEQTIDMVKLVLC
jgi:hypothetical protein